MERRRTKNSYSSMQYVPSGCASHVGVPLVGRRGECGSLGFSTPNCGVAEHGLACSKRQGTQSFFIVTESYESWSIYSTATQLPSPHSKERQSNHNHNHDAATPATNHVPGSLHAPVAACVQPAATSARPTGWPKHKKECKLFKEKKQVYALLDSSSKEGSGEAAASNGAHAHASSGGGGGGGGAAAFS